MSLDYSTLSATAVVPWSELTNLLARADDTEEFYEPEDLAEELDEPGFDPGRDSVAVWDADRLVGYGQLRVKDGMRDGVAKASIGGGVHPDHRGRGIGRTIMDRLEPRALELSGERHPGAPVTIDLWVGPAGASAERLAVARGYRLVRYFTDMRVGLREGVTGWDSSLRLPEGNRLEVFTPGLAEGVRRAHNEAFADHWGSAPRSAESWADQLAARSFRPSLSRIVVSEGRDRGSEDRVEAYALCGEWVEGELYVSLVGTRRRARRQGMGSVLLEAVVQAAARSGYRTVDLTVDSASPTGAGRVYERAGFRPVRTSSVYQLQVG